MAKAAVEKIRNMTTDDMRGITLLFSKEWRGVQPLVLVWAHLLRLYLTCCSFRYGTSSARFSIGFPADILQETAVHQSRGRRRGAEKGGGGAGTRGKEEFVVTMRSANALNLHSWLSISKSETLVIFVVLTPLINAALGMVQGAGHVLRWLVVTRVEVKNVYLARCTRWITLVGSHKGESQGLQSFFFYRGT
jgi:hypothetical protein